MQEKTFRNPEEIAEPQIVIFSAINIIELKKIVEKHYSFFNSNTDLSLIDIAYSLQIKNEDKKCRLALIVNNNEELISGLEDYLKPVEKKETFDEIPVYSGCLDYENAKLKSLIKSKAGEYILPWLLYDNDPEKIAVYWVNGGKILWENIHKNKTGRIIENLVNL